MSEEFGPDFISVTDEEGNEFELDLVDTLEHNGVRGRGDRRASRCGCR